MRYLKLENIYCYIILNIKRRGKMKQGRGIENCICGGGREWGNDNEQALV